MFFEYFILLKYKLHPDWLRQPQSKGPLPLMEVLPEMSPQK